MQEDQKRNQASKHHINDHQVSPSPHLYTDPRDSHIDIGDIHAIGQETLCVGDHA